MSNLFKIKRGATVPTSDVLSAYELGFMTEGGKLYIGLGDRVKMLTAGPSSTSPKAAGNASVGTEDTFARGDHIHPLQTSVSGNAGTATKLKTARTIQTNLASTSSASFNGSANITPGVTGTLPIANGGTGATTAADACANLGAVKKSGDKITGNLSLVGGLEFAPGSSAGHGGYIDFHFSGDSSDYTTRIIEDHKGFLSITGGLRLGSALSVGYGGTGATTAADACWNLGAVKKSGDTMTGSLVNTSTIVIQRDIYPTLYFNTAAGKNKAAVICTAGAADHNGGIILRGWNSDSSDYRDLVLTYGNNMAVPVSNGGRRIKRYKSCSNLIMCTASPAIRPRQGFIERRV